MATKYNKESIIEMGNSFSCLFGESITEFNGIEGLTICITGTLTFGRKQYIRFIKEHGGRFIREISGNVNYMLRGERCGIKESLAKGKGIKFISENELFRMAGVNRLF